MQVKKKPKKTAKAVPEKSRKKKQPSEDQIKKQPFLKRMLFGEEKPDLSELEAGSTTILDILSPTTVDTTMFPLRSTRHQRNMKPLPLHPPICA